MSPQRIAFWVLTDGIAVLAPRLSVPGAASVTVFTYASRASGGVADALAAVIARARPRARVDALTAADSFLPLGPAADAVLVQEDEIVRRARQLVRGPGERPWRARP